MTGKKTVILVAWDNETKALSDSDRQKLADNNIALLYTGIGKNNASNGTNDIVGYYDRVINIGCVGTHTQELETYSRVTTFVERDMDCRSFNYAQYQTPEEKYIFINFDESGNFVNTSMDTPLGLICVEVEITLTVTQKLPTLSQHLTLWIWRPTLWLRSV